MRILEIIPEGADNAISAKELSEALGVDRRTMYKLIEQARNKGAVICCNVGNGGYFIPALPSEALEYVREEQLKIASRKKSLESAVRFVEGGDSE